MRYSLCNANLVPPPPILKVDNGCVIAEREARQLIVSHGDPAYVCMYVCIIYK